MARCRCQRAAANGVGWSASLVGHEDSPEVTQRLGAGLPRMTLELFFCKSKMALGLFFYYTRDANCVTPLEMSLPRARVDLARCGPWSAVIARAPGGRPMAAPALKRAHRPKGTCSVVATLAGAGTQRKPPKTIRVLRLLLRQSFRVKTPSFGGICGLFVIFGRNIRFILPFLSSLVGIDAILINCFGASVVISFFAVAKGQMAIV